MLNCEGNFLPDCDTEFIHFSERMDCSEQTESITSLETCQPNSSHQDYANMIKQLQTEAPEVVMTKTALLQLEHTPRPDSPSRALVRLEPLAFPQGLSLKAILSVTGTFDVEKFNRGFEEDMRKFLEEQEKERKLQEELMERERNEKHPVSLEEENVKELINSRTWVHQPISPWFSRQLILMSLRDLQDSQQELQLEELEENVELETSLRLRLNIPTEIGVVHYQCQEHYHETEEQDDPLDLKLTQTELEPEVSSAEENCEDLSQMIPVDAIIEVINQESDSSTFYPDSCNSEIGEESSPGPFSETSSRSPSSISSSPPPEALAVSFPVIAVHNKAQTIHDLKSDNFKKVDRLNKKRIRMMKNREAANNSRRKKKEYMNSLESKVSNLVSDNSSLKDENEKLKALILKLHATDTL